MKTITNASKITPYLQDSALLLLSAISLRVSKSHYSVLRLPPRITASAANNARNCSFSLCDNPTVQYFTFYRSIKCLLSSVRCQWRCEMMLISERPKSEYPAYCWVNCRSCLCAGRGERESKQSSLDNTTKDGDFKDAQAAPSFCTSARGAYRIYSSEQGSTHISPLARRCSGSTGLLKLLLCLLRCSTEFHQQATACTTLAPAPSEETLRVLASSSVCAARFHFSHFSWAESAPDHYRLMLTPLLFFWLFLWSYFLEPIFA